MTHPPACPSPPPKFSLWITSVPIVTESNTHHGLIKLVFATSLGLPTWELVNHLKLPSTKTLNLSCQVMSVLTWKLLSKIPSRGLVYITSCFDWKWWKLNQTPIHVNNMFYYRRHCKLSGTFAQKLYQIYILSWKVNFFSIHPTIWSTATLWSTTPVDLPRPHADQNTSVPTFWLNPKQSRPSPVLLIWPIHRYAHWPQLGNQST